MARAKKVDQALAELAPVEADPSCEDAATRLGVALTSPHAHVVARAAAIIGEHRLGGHGAGLLSAWDRLRQDGAKRDPGCHAKVAVLEALDHTEHPDADPFLAATRWWRPPTRMAYTARPCVAYWATSDLRSRSSTC